MKKFSAAVFALFILVCSSFAESVNFNEFKLEADVYMKLSDANPSKFGWRDILYAENVVLEGSDQAYLLKVSNIKKGYSALSLYQDGGKPVAVNTNGKEQKIVPGKIFSKEGGTVWLSFKAPDKKTYSLPTDIRVVLPEEFVSEVTYGPVISKENPSVEVETENKKNSEETAENFIDEDEYLVLRTSDDFPPATDELPVAAFAGINRQHAEKGSNVVPVIKNLPLGTKPKLFIVDNTEVLVYIAPDMSFVSPDNCYTLFYSIRKGTKDEDFSIPKRVVENPKVNGKLTNMLDFDGYVTSIGGKKKLVLCWTQTSIPVDDEVLEEEVYKNTRIYWSSWKENDEKWDKCDIVSDFIGSFQFKPELRAGPDGLCLKVTNRTDNQVYAEVENPAFPEKHLYFVLNKKAHWEAGSEKSFPDLRYQYPFTDGNRTVPENFKYVFNKDGVLSGAVWSDGSGVYAKTYVKSPDTKKMIWTESVPVVLQNKKNPGKIQFPQAVVRSDGDWIVTYLLEDENGKNICISRNVYEPCIITRRMWPNEADMQHPGGSVRFTVEVENAGLGIADGLDVLIRNEFKAEAGKNTYKQNFYPGRVYKLDGIYQSLKGKDGIVPVEEIKGEVKLAKMKQNSQYGHFDARFTMGIPLYHIGDMFTVTKGKSQKVVFTCGTRNGVKVKASTAEVYITEHLENDEYEDNNEKVLVDEYFSDSYSEMSYDYVTGDFDEPVFDFIAKLHYAPEKFKMSGYDFEDLDDSTAYEFTGKVKNPKFYKESTTLKAGSSTFTKKNKVMKTSFSISNNWPEAVSKKVYVKLVNKTNGQTEQSLEIPVEISVLQCLNYEIEFDPALSELEEDYEVIIQN